MPRRRKARIPGHTQGGIDLSKGLATWKNKVQGTRYKIFALVPCSLLLIPCSLLLALALSASNALAGAPPQIATPNVADDERWTMDDGRYSSASSVVHRPSSAPTTPYSVLYDQYDNAATG